VIAIAHRLHHDALEAASALDRGYAQRHPHARSYMRPALEHELCPPGGPCARPTTILVTFWAPGVRSRLAVHP
jgi:hypothetical protein